MITHDYNSLEQRKTTTPEKLYDKVKEYVNHADRIITDNMDVEARYKALAGLYKHFDTENGGYIDPIRNAPDIDGVTKKEVGIGEHSTGNALSRFIKYAKEEFSKIRLKSVDSDGVEHYAYDMDWHPLKGFNEAQDLLFMLMTVISYDGEFYWKQVKIRTGEELPKFWEQNINTTERKKEQEKNSPSQSSFTDFERRTKHLIETLKNKQSYMETEDEMEVLLAGGVAGRDSSQYWTDYPFFEEFAQNNTIDIDPVLNREIRDYEIMAERFLGYADVQERINALKGLIKKLQEKYGLENGFKKEWTYIIRRNPNDRFEPVRGYLDYQMYKCLYKNRIARAQMQYCLYEDVKRGNPYSNFSLLQLFNFHSALLIELERAEIEKSITHQGGGDDIDQGCDNNSVPHHFSLSNDDTNIAWLKRVWAKLKKYGYIHKDTKVKDWIFVCTGVGEEPNNPIQWLKDDDELGYFVQQFFQDKKKYDRAVHCFLLKSGDVPKATNLRTNVTQKPEKRDSLYAIIHMK